MFTPAAVLRIIRTSTRLRELQVTFASNERSDDIATHTIINLTELRDLTLKHISPKLSITPILDHLKAPELEKMQLGLSHSCDLLVARDFIRRTPSTSLRLRQLTIHATINAQEVFVELLSELKALDALVIYHVAVAGYLHIDPLLHSLRREHQDRRRPFATPFHYERTSTFCLCPHLKKLELGRLSLSSHFLEAMVRSRLPTGNSEKHHYPGSFSPLKVLKLSGIGLVEGPDDLQWLKDLVEQGTLEASDSSRWISD